MISKNNKQSHIMEFKIKFRTKSQWEIFSYIYCTFDLEPFVSFSFRPIAGQQLKNNTG